jgi:lipooligosaccharide transport system permease protein
MTTPGAVRYFEARARTYRHTWRGTVISSFANPVMYLAAMGLGLGTLVDEGPVAAAAGISYLSYLAPGMLAATMMQSAASDSAWPVMAYIKWLKTYDAVLATPMNVRDIVAGHIGFVAARMTFIAVVFTFIAVLFGAYDLPRGLLAVLPAVLTGITFGSVVMAYTTRLENDTGLSNLFRFGIVPMFLFSGVFFPISQLPDWLEPVAFITPLWHGVQLTRAVALDIPTRIPALISVAYLVALSVVGAVLAARWLQRRLVS